MKKNTRALTLALSIASLIHLVATPATADARTDYLINMLENGGNYRIRVQAATTLGKLRSAVAVPALVKALGDESDLVIISAATALGQIGNPTVIPEIERALIKPPTSAARSQLEATLRVLKALSPDSSGDALADATPRYFIRIDAMGNSSGVGRKEIVDVLRDTVVKRLAKEPGVVMQQPGLSNQQVKKKLKKDKLAGYILSGSLIRMERLDDKIVVKIGLNVFTNPEYNLLMMPTAEGAIPFSSGSLSTETERTLQDKALKAVADRLIANILRKLRQIETP